MMKRLYSAVWHFLLFNSKVNFFIYVVLDYSLYSLTLKKKKKKKASFSFLLPRFLEESALLTSCSYKS